MLDLTPHATATHWSARWIGRAWLPSFTCWGLVREVQREVFGRSLPELTLDSTEHDRSSVLSPLLRGGAWRLADAPGEGDVLELRGPDGPHVGVAAVLAGRATLLHNLGDVLGGQPRGSVRRDAVDQLHHLGYGRLRCWRAAA